MYMCHANKVNVAKEMKKECRWPSTCTVRELMIQQWWHPWKRYWKVDSASFQTISRFSQVILLLKRRDFRLDWREEATPEFKQEIVEFIVLLFPSSKKYKIWSFRVGVVQGWQRNVQNSVMRVQSCCFAN